MVREGRPETQASRYYALFYETVDHFLRRRAPFRDEHLALARQAHEEGRLVLAGAFDPPDGALLVFRAGGKEEVEAFARQDPYVREGLVRRWWVKEWSVVVGDAEK